MSPRPKPLGAAARRDLLSLVQRLAPVTVAALARRSGTTPEAARQALAGLERARLVARARPAPRAGRRRGRPAQTWALTTAGLEALPKAYADMTLAALDAVARGLGPDALRRTLGALTDARVRALAPKVRGRTLAERVRALRAVYREDDAFLKVERRGDGWRLVERNCPFLRVALERPAVCSTTVATLSRLLGCRVVREERFQSGDGCCAFRVEPAVPADEFATGFEPEPEPPAGKAA
jgi:predicted ArsR family transcriptional regulator